MKADDKMFPLEKMLSDYVQTALNLYQRLLSCAMKLLACQIGIDTRLVCEIIKLFASELCTSVVSRRRASVESVKRGLMRIGFLEPGSFVDEICEYATKKGHVSLLGFLTDLRAKLREVMLRVKILLETEGVEHALIVGEDCGEKMSESPSVVAEVSRSVSFGSEGSRFSPPQSEVEAREGSVSGSESEIENQSS